jgi:hypothetical protein
MTCLVFSIPTSHSNQVATECAPMVGTMIQLKTCADPVRLADFISDSALERFSEFSVTLLFISLSDKPKDLYHHVKIKNERFHCLQ